MPCRPSALAASMSTIRHRPCTTTTSSPYLRSRPPGRRRAAVVLGSAPCRPQVLAVSVASSLCHVIPKWLHTMPSLSACRICVRHQAPCFLHHLSLLSQYLRSRPRRLALSSPTSYHALPPQVVAACRPQVLAASLSSLTVHTTTPPYLRPVPPCQRTCICLTSSVLESTAFTFPPHPPPPPRYMMSHPEFARPEWPPLADPHLVSYPTRHELVCA